MLDQNVMLERIALSKPTYAIAIESQLTAGVIFFCGAGTQQVAIHSPLHAQLHSAVVLQN